MVITILKSSGGRAHSTFSILATSMAIEIDIMLEKQLQKSMTVLLMKHYHLDIAWFKENGFWQVKSLIMLRCGYYDHSDHQNNSIL